MDTYAARLASFNATLTTQKKRASDAKGSKTLKWPHAAPSIIQVCARSLLPYMIINILNSSPKLVSFTNQRLQIRTMPLAIFAIAILTAGRRRMSP